MSRTPVAEVGADDPHARLCECGCGQTPKPGKRYVFPHQSYARKRAEPRQPRSEQCPRCGKAAAVRDDGTLGAHFAVRGKHTERIRCAAGAQLPVTGERGRRVTVTLDVVLPHGWSVAAFKARAAAAIRREVDEAFLVDLTAEEAAS